MTGFAASLYYLGLEAAASGLSSSCWTSGSPMMSSVPYNDSRGRWVCKFKTNLIYIVQTSQGSIKTFLFHTFNPPENMAAACSTVAAPELCSQAHSCLEAAEVNLAKAGWGGIGSGNSDGPLKLAMTTDILLQLGTLEFTPLVHYHRRGEAMPDLMATMLRTQHCFRNSRMTLGQQPCSPLGRQQWLVKLADHFHSYLWKQRCNWVFFRGELGFAK